MARLNTAGPPGLPAGGKRQMSTAMAIALMTVGAILLFALSAGSPHWINLRIVGAILITAGILGLALPRLARSGANRVRRWRAPTSAQRDESQPGVARYFVPRSDLNGSGPTLADDILGLEHEPPL
jgi:hypothetical protein